MMVSGVDPAIQRLTRAEFEVCTVEMCEFCRKGCEQHTYLGAAGQCMDGKDRLKIQSESLGDVYDVFCVREEAE